jgi:hypothetical protein
MKKVTKEIKEYKMDKLELQKLILKALGISLDEEAFNSVVFKWEINNNKELNEILIITEKIIG